MAIVIILLENKYAKTYKFNWIILALSIILVFLICVKLSSYTLNGYNDRLITGIIGSMVGINSIIKLNRKKLIISGIISSILVFAISSKYQLEIKRISKPIRYAIEYVQDKGYEINDNDYILVLSNEYTRLKPIKISVLRIEENKNLVRDLNMKYYQEKIKDFEVIIDK